MSPASLLKWLHTIISIRCQEVVPSSSDSNQVVVEQWETEKRQLLSFPFIKDRGERFWAFLSLSFSNFLLFFKKCVTLLKCREKATVRTPWKLFSCLLMNEMHFWISLWEMDEDEGLSETQRKWRPPVVSWTESNREGTQRDTIHKAFWLYFTLGSGNNNT